METTDQPKSATESSSESKLPTNESEHGTLELLVSGLFVFGFGIFGWILNQGIFVMPSSSARPGGSWSFVVPGARVTAMG